MYKLDDYETVAMLNKWFIENYPMGRTNIEITYHDVEKGYITCKAEVYRDANDPYPATSNIAHGVRDQYIQNMRRFYAEDIASSSLGRAITLLKGGNTATRDDMEKVGQVAGQATPKPFTEKLAEKIIMPVEDDPWTIKAVEPAGTITDAIALMTEVMGASKIDKDIPRCRNCHDHKPMDWKTGVSAKTKKPWGKFDCYVCRDVIWYNINSQGTWSPQEVKS
jgi:hypothetical protein